MGLFLGAPFEIVDYYTLFETRWSRVKFELDSEERERESRHSYSLFHLYGNLASISNIIPRNVCFYPYAMTARGKFDCKRCAILHYRAKISSAEKVSKKRYFV